jgi:hypothetical protein
VLLKDFAGWAQALTLQVRDGCERMAQELGIETRYLNSSSVNKEELARQIATERGIASGPICMFSVVEPSLSPTVLGCRTTKKLEVQMRPRKCVWLYVYFNDPVIGFGHLRLQSWLPFTIKGCINGRHWLERSLTSAGIDFIKQDNCFRWIGDVERAQQLFDEQLRTDWAQMLGALKDRYFGFLGALFNPPMHYYWSADESEWASDIMFNNTTELDRLFPMLARHAVVVSDSASVMRYLGRADGPAALRNIGEVRTDRSRRYEGMCVKHRIGTNSVKTYNKAGNVLRLETTINDTRDFKVFRHPDDNVKKPASWQKMRKGVADLHRRSRVSQASNERYANALASCPANVTVIESVAPITQRTERKGRCVRALNPLNNEDAHLLRLLAQGQWTINGLRNRDLAQWICPGCDKLSLAQRKRLTSRASRLLGLLQAHGLIRKISKTHRYQITTKGRHAATLVASASTVQASDFIELAA